MKTLPSLLLLTFAGAIALPHLTAQAGVARWTQFDGGNASGSWNTPADPPWSIAAVPGAGDVADFNTLDIAGTSFLSLDGDQSIDDLIFGDTSTASPGIWFLVPGANELSTLTLSGSAPTITVNTLGTGTAAIEVPLAGTGGLTKEGVGRLTLTNSLFTGHVVVNAGTLGIGRGDAALGAVPEEFTPDAITLNGGTLYNLFRTNQVTSITINSNRGLTITPNGGTLFVNNAGQTMTFLGALTGEGTLFKTGAGRAALAGEADTFTGRISVTAGQLSYGVNGGRLGAEPAEFEATNISLNNGGLNNNAAGFLVNWTVPPNRGVFLGANGGFFNVESSSGNVTISANSVISGSGQLRKAGGGGLILNAANTYTGGTVVSNGPIITASTGAALMLGNPSGLGSGAVTFINTNDLTGFRYGGVNGGRVPNNFTLSTNANLTNRWRVDEGRTVTLAGVISGGHEDSTLAKDSLGTLALAGHNSYRGQTRVDAGRLMGVTGGSLSNSPVSVTALSLAAGFGVRVTDNTRPFVCSTAAFNLGLTLPLLEFAFSTPASTDLAPLHITGEVAFNETPTVVVHAAPLAVTTGNGYPLMTWGSMSGTPPASWNLQIEPPGQAFGELAVIGNTLYLQITSTTQPLRWAAGNGNWDAASFEFNWMNSAQPPYSTYFQDGDAVQFEDTQNAGGGIITINGPVAPSSVLVNSINHYTFTGAEHAVIAGFGQIIKTGPGTLTIGGAGGNTFSGGLVVQQGTLVAAKPDGTSYGAAGIGNVEVASGARLVADGDNSLAGVLTASSRTLTIQAGATVTNTGTTSCKLNRVLLNGGVLGATAPNPERGSWALGQGVATLGGGSVSTIVGGNLALSQIGGTIFNVLMGDTVDIFSTIEHTPESPDTGLIKNGAGTLNLWNSCTSTGAVTLNSGTLRLGHPHALPGGLLTFGSGLTIASADATPRILTNSLFSNIASAVLNFGDATGTGPLTFTGPLSFASGTTGRGFVTTTDVEFAGPITGANGPFTKTGAGTLTLSGDVTVSWSGGWNINVGALRVNGSLISTSPVTIATSARLEGAGSINAAVNLQPGSELAPGASIGTLTLSAAPAWAGATVRMELDQTAPQTADRLQLTSGALDFTGATLVLENLGPALTNGVFALFSPGNTGVFASIVAPELEAGLSWDFSALAAEGVARVVSSQTAEVGWSLDGDQLTLTWPASLLGWTLQMQTNSLDVGLSNNWVDVPGTDSVTSYTVTVNPALPTVFFRLRN